MTSPNDLSGKVGLDTTDFKTNIASMNRELRVLESSFRASAAGLGDWAKDASGLELRIKSLNSQIDLQKTKVSALEDEYKRVSEEKGATSRAAQELQIKLNRETETLGKMEAELGKTERALSEMGDETQKTGKDTDKLQKEEEQATGATNKFAKSLNGLKDKLGSAGGGLKGMVGSVAKVTAGLAVGLVGAATAATAGIVGLVAKTVPAASDLSETVNKVNVIFGDAADSVLEFSDSAASALGQSKQQALDAAATFATFGKAAGLTGADLSNFSTDLVGLASDLASFNNAEPQEVVEALGAALRGEAEPMRRFGVLLDDATLKQAAMEAGIIRSTNEALTPQQKVLAAYEVVLAQTTDAQGDFARTSDGLANSQRIVAAQFENLKASAGEIFLPVIEEVFQFLASEFMPLIQDTMVPWLKEHLPKAIDTLKQFWSNVLLPAIRDVWNWLKTVLIPFLQQVVFPWLQENIPKALQTLSDFWTNVLQPAIQTVWNWIRTVLIPFFQNVIIPWLQDNIPKALQTLSDFWTGVLQPALETVWNFLVTYVVPILEDVWEWLENNIPPAIEALARLWEETLKPALETVWKFLIEDVVPILEKVWEWLGDVADKAGEVAGGALTTLKNVFIGIRDAVQWVIDKILIFLEKLGLVKLPPALQRESPSPFEMAFIGANAALAELTERRLPALSRQLNSLPVSPLGGASTVNTVTTNNSYIIQAANPLQTSDDLVRQVRLLELMHA